MKKLVIELDFKHCQSGEWKCRLSRNDYYDVIDSFRFEGPTGNKIFLCRHDGYILNEWKQIAAPMHTAPFMGQDLPLCSLSPGLEPYLLSKIPVTGTASCKMISSQYVDYFINQKLIRYNDLCEPFTIINGIIEIDLMDGLVNGEEKCCLCQ